MVRILTEPRNALVKQYQQFFRMENTFLEFTDEALHAIATKAMKRDVGARALRAVVEEIMMALMYDLPEKKEDKAIYQITAAMVNGEAEPTLFSARKVKKESA
jgi:ATP-dependent Clp protease ATP-binding subunit ClpX